MQQIELATAKIRCFLETFGFLIAIGADFGFVSSFMADIRALEFWRARFVIFLAEKWEIVSASRRRSARDCKGAIVERVFGAVPMKELVVDFEAEVDALVCLVRVEVVLAAVKAVRTGRAGVGIATGMIGAAGAIGAVKFSGADFGSGALKMRGVETGVEVVTGAGAEKSSGAATGAGAENSNGAETGAGAEKSSGAEIWIWEAVERDFGADVVLIFEVWRIALLFSSDSRSESKEIVTFFGVETWAGAACEVMVEAGWADVVEWADVIVAAGVRMSETADMSSEKTILRGALTKWRLRVPEFLTVIWAARLWTRWFVKFLSIFPRLFLFNYNNNTYANQ